jgi:hypothetical protein
MLIGLTGHANAGKYSVAAVLCAAGWRSIAFADALRTEVSAAWSIDQRLLTDRAQKEQAVAALCVGRGNNANWLRWATMRDRPLSLIEPRSARWVLQQWGDFRRAADPNYWVRHVCYWVQYQRQHGAQHLVVTDVRYGNEAFSLRGLGGHIVRVHRPGSSPLAADTRAHSSEQITDLKTDADIANDSALAALGTEVWRVVEQLASQTAPTHPNGDPTHA